MGGGATSVRGGADLFTALLAVGSISLVWGAAVNTVFSFLLSPNIGVL